MEGKNNNKKIKFLSIIVVIILLILVVAVIVIKSEKAGTKLGDADGNGKVTVEDYNLLSKYIGKVSNIEVTSSADMNEDGVINSKDLILLEKIVLKDTTLHGDVNLDGKVTYEDAEYLLFYTFFPSDYPLTSQGKINADVDGDGQITDQDVVEIMDCYSLKQPN